jgi:hypothetical protein
MSSNSVVESIKSEVSGRSHSAVVVACMAVVLSSLDGKFDVLPTTAVVLPTNI